MPQKFRFLVHRCFQEQLDKFVEINLDAWSSLKTQMKKAKSDPFRAGKAMRDIPISRLQGRIYRLHVRGPGGFRFIYLVDNSRKLVMGIFVSLEVKANFDYEKVPWEEYASEIYEDIVNGNIEKFTEFTFNN